MNSPNPVPGNHILDAFDTALGALRDDALMMAGLTERALANAMRGLLERDDELCLRAIADDEEIDDLEIQVDRAGIQTLLRFQPVASDLRQVVSTMKLAGNLERIADQAVSIARRARKLNRRTALEEVPLIEPMYRATLEMYRDALRAFVERDEGLAETLKPRDREIDEMNRTIGARITEKMTVAPDRIESYLALIFVARHLERVGDHAVNMGEDAVYAVAARDIRHAGAGGK